MMEDSKIPFKGQANTINDSKELDENSGKPEGIPDLYVCFYLFFQSRNAGPVLPSAFSRNTKNLVFFMWRVLILASN